MSQLPFFYEPQLKASDSSLTLDEATSKHVVQVLRMQQGEQLKLTNGKGFVVVAAISEAHKKHVQVSVVSSEQHAPKQRRVAIAVSPVKNSSRYEWFLEKATELGVTNIYPLLCHRTERSHFRSDRMQAICISAMLQSQQSWLPLLHEPILFDELVAAGEQYPDKWIAHCTESLKQPLTAVIPERLENALMLIGPEGDFTDAEITLALANAFQPVSLGDTRLRTETAALTAAVLLLLH